ncbi:UvrD-helicase domain-containing protein [Bacteroidales bacterium OttesenSCG-928-C19]|nr:UvrD-helicase domain-containing protein [Bacteroidales bacterium OttesenSCG-928-C19]
MTELLNALNEEQRLAAECTEGPVMIIAGAGSGKTRTLTYRIAHLIEKGIDPFRILALTFTNKAATEMKTRIMQLTGNDARNIWMGTFHSVFAKILRFEAEKIGYISSFTIYDSDDSKNAVKQIIKGMNLDPKTYNPGYVLSRISMAKNSLISADEYAKNPEIQQADIYAKKPMIADIYKQYNLRLRNSMAMDFDDLLYNMNVLLRDFPDVLLKYQEKFRYILVDEYQDTNYSQYLIVKKLAARYENICVVGDDAQSIYAFRGANIQNILNFKRDYSDVKMFKLEQNYRSTQNIVNAANSIIEKNKEQIFKEIWTDNEAGEKIRVMRAASEQEEGSLVVNSIFDHKFLDQAANKDFAILYRTNIQSRAIEEALRKRNIPYKIYGGLSFYKRKEIKDVLSYLRLVVNNNDDEALLRVVNYPVRGIGQTTIDKIRIVAVDHDCSMFTVMENLESFPIQLNSGTRTKIEEFIYMIKAFTAQLHSTNAFDLAQKIVMKSGIIRFLKEEDEPESANRIENIEELLNGIKEFCEKDDENLNELLEELNGNQNHTLKTLDIFLQQVLLLSGDEDEDKENNDKVSMMTIHAAKGLEFPYVYVVGLEENLFPSAMCLGDRRQLEEERRLFYVAVTRAEKKLTLSYAQTRYQYGSASYQEPSRFLEDVNEAFIEMPVAPKRFTQKETREEYVPLKKNLDPIKLKKIAAIANQPQAMPADTSTIKEGMTVMHDKFGQGKVIAIEGDDANKKATVFFDGFGQKVLILRFAKLKVV